MARRAPAARTGPLEAYLLHRYDWSESSLIIELFTRERGRVAAVARGAKRPYSQFRSILLPFQRVWVTLGAAGKDEAADIHPLKQAEWAGGGPLVPPAALFSAYYANELIIKSLARHDAHPVLFDSYAATLATLAAGHDTLTQAALRAFELRLLEQTGLLPDLGTSTLTLQPLREAERYALRPESGVVATAEPTGSFSSADLLALQQALAHGTPAALQGACLPCLPALRASLRGLLHYHLGTSQLRTRQVMQSVQRLIDGAPGVPASAVPEALAVAADLDTAPLAKPVAPFPSSPPNSPATAHVPP